LDGGEGWGEEVLVPHGERMGSLMQPCNRSAREQKGVTPRFQGVKQVAVKVIDQRGNELQVVESLREAGK
jgi:hypothetical protein